MKNTLLISIIIPVYNRAHLVPAAIQSVLNQTEINWELIIVDDCSTDNIKGVISEYKDERIKFFRLPLNKGNAGARNEGVRNAKGEYIFFLDSDDIMLPNALNCFTEQYSKTPNIDFAFGGYQTKNQTTGVTNEIFWKPSKKIPFIKELKIGTGCGLFVRRDIFDNVGLFDERLRVAVDTDWLIRLDNEGYKPTILKDILVIVNIHDGDRVRKDKMNLLNAYNIIFQKNKKLINKDRALIKKFLYKFQWLNYHQGQIKQGNKFFYQLISKKIFSKKSILLLLMFNSFNVKKARNLHARISGQKI